MQLGILPGVDLDVQYDLFYGFAAVSVLLPAVSKGSWVPLAFGAGVNLPRDSQWKLEIYALYAPSCVEPSGKWWYHAYGLGLGVHYTRPNGLTLGFKIPLVGLAERSGSWSGSYSTSDKARQFYIDAAVSLPLFSIGYRF